MLLVLGACGCVRGLRVGVMREDIFRVDYKPTRLTRNTTVGKESRLGNSPWLYRKVVQWALSIVSASLAGATRQNHQEAKDSDSNLSFGRSKTILTLSGAL